MKIKLTKSIVDKIEYPETGRGRYIDTELKGFGLRVGKTKKTYFAEKRVNGKPVLVTIGEHGQITTEQARDEAKNILGLMSGRNPLNINQEKKIRRTKGITLSKALEEYLIARPALSPYTVQDYKYVTSKYLKDWTNKSLNSITREMVEHRHRWIGNGHGGEAQANKAMRNLRAIYNYMIGKYGRETIPVNAVEVISLNRAWYKIKRRQTLIKAYELPALFDALDELVKESDNTNAQAVKDYILLLLFTGMRKQEGLTLKWETVDLRDKTFTLEKTKNGDPLTLPISDYMLEIFERRYKNKVNEYVFAGRASESHLVEPKRHLKRIKELSEIEFTLHDLRRTYITIAESLDISYFALKRLVNHRVGNDVTSGYIIHNAERLRKPMQQITDKILFEAQRRGQAKVIIMKAK